MSQVSSEDQGFFLCLAVFRYRLVRSTILPSIITYTGVPVSRPICRTRLAARRRAGYEPMMSGPLN